MENKIILANSNVNSQWFSEKLTEYAAGFPCDKIKKILDLIAPEVRVPRAFEYYISGEGSFKYDAVELKPGEDGNVRMLHCGFATVNSSSRVVNAKCNMYGLTTIIEDDEEFLQEQAVEELKTTLLTQDLIRAVKLLDSLSGDSTSKVWKKGGTNNPISDVKSLIAGVGDKGTFNANKVLYGYSAWNMSSEYFGSDSPNYTLAPDALALPLGLDALAVSNDRAFMLSEESEENGGISQYIVPPNKVYALVSTNKLSRQDFSVMKRFVARPLTVFSREVSGGLEISVFTVALIAQTGQGAVKSYTISNS